MALYGSKKSTFQKGALLKPPACLNVWLRTCWGLVCNARKTKKQLTSTLISVCVEGLMIIVFYYSRCGRRNATVIYFGLATVSSLTILCLILTGRSAEKQQLFLSLFKSCFQTLKKRK